MFATDLEESLGTVESTQVGEVLCDRGDFAMEESVQLRIGASSRGVLRYSGEYAG